MVGGEAGSCCFWLKIVRWRVVVVKPPLPTFLLKLFSFAIPRSKSVAGAPGHTRQINKFVDCSTTVFQDQFTNYRDFFVRSGG
jgi:hypothetical protein